MRLCLILFPVRKRGRLGAVQRLTVAIMPKSVDYLVCQGDDLSSILYRIDESDFTFSSLRMDGHDQLREISTMEDETDDIVVISDRSEQGNNSNKKEKRKKKKESNYLPGMVLSVGSRRKGAPHRAPFS
ncbi:hypothetical protein F2Q68_00043965 [Brassica cretica]|uniref:Uncharacterized protein n=2 Tax=Brassica cretica TaxID=69181 RepID=A0A8S9LQF0_BRACR|nr:hypothetical protein F2Q68_00043965 [Brassica cretica]